MVFHSLEACTQAFMCQGTSYKNVMLAISQNLSPFLPNHCNLLYLWYMGFVHKGNELLYELSEVAHAWIQGGYRAKILIFIWMVSSLKNPSNIQIKSFSMLFVGLVQRSSSLMKKMILCCFTKWCDLRYALCWKDSYELSNTLWRLIMRFQENFLGGELAYDCESWSLTHVIKRIWINDTISIMK